jgi:hypothetical protein
VQVDERADGSQSLDDGWLSKVAFGGTPQNGYSSSAISPGGFIGPPALAFQIARIASGSLQSALPNRPAASSWYAANASGWPIIPCSSDESSSASFPVRLLAADQTMPRLRCSAAQSVRKLARWTCH